MKIFVAETGSERAVEAHFFQLVNKCLLLCQYRELHSL